MHIFVTGYEGYIGPILIRTLKEHGYFITGLDIGYFRHCLDDFKSITQPDRRINKDIRDIELADLEGIDAVVHLSAISNDPMGQLNPKVTDDINHKASIKLATLAKEAGISRFIFASSCSIYGAADNFDKPLDETAPFNPVTAYAHSKVNSERAISKMADSRFSPVFLRNATAYGVSPRMRFDLVLPNLMASGMTTKIVKVLSDGSPWRPLVHIEDISLAVCAVLKAKCEIIHNEAFNIGRNDANYQIKDIADGVCNALGNVKLDITGETGGDKRSYRVDFSKATNVLLDFKPKWTLEKGCEELQKWFMRRHDFSMKEVNTRKYVRLLQLQHLINSKVVDDSLRVIGNIK